MALSFNGIPWANFRGYCYDPIETDARGTASVPFGTPTPGPQETFTSWWKNGKAPTYPIQVNFGRIDWMGWLGFYNGGSLYPGNPAAYKAAVNDVFNWADSAGIALVINQVFSLLNETTAWLPSLAALGWPTVWSDWYQNTPYPGTEPEYQGLSFWEAQWEGFSKPFIQMIDSHPSVVGYKIDNEPGINTSSVSNQILKAVGDFFAPKLRTVSTKPIIFQTPGENPSSGLSVADIIACAPSSAYAPSIFSIHYPDPNATSIANLTYMNLIQNAIAGGQVPGCVGWYIDEVNSGFFDSVHLQGCQQFGIPGPLGFIYRVRSLLDSSGNPTSDCLMESSQCLQYLGTPLYSGGGPPPPPTPTVLSLTAKQV